MSFFYPLPEEDTVYERVERMAEPCPACRKHEVARYRVLRSVGWQEVVRCRACLHTISAVPVAQSFVPLTHGWPTSSAG